MIVGYYTDKYQADAVDFVRSCILHNVPVYCEHVPDRGSWALNTSFKPTFLESCMNRFNTNIVYCDVDARFERYPWLFDNVEHDIMFYKGNVWGAGHDEEVLSGTVYLSNNKKVKNFLANWKNACNNNNQEWDQRLLYQSLPEGIVTGMLPVEYCAIFDSPKIAGKEIVIRHLQHSRLAR
jgi:hypothetical protein